jgi:diguanylate cyclase (GGDEF)-like protein/PAS domain S-box-containing protein
MTTSQGHRSSLEEQLRQSDSYAHLLVDNLKDYVVLTIDLKGCITHWNRGALDVLGYAEGELAGMSLSLIFTPEDRKLKIAEREISRAKLVGKSPDIRWHVRKDGTRFWADGIIVSLTDSSGKLRGYSKLFQDNTERKVNEEALHKSEKQHKMMMENIKDYAIYTLDPEGNINSSWNEGAERIYGYTEDEVLGKYFGMFYTPEDIDSEQPKREMQQAKRNGRAEYEYWRVRKDGSQFWGDEIINALCDDQGVLQGFVKVTRDITERKRHEETIHYQAFHDPLTGLPNRALGGERLIQAMSTADRSKEIVAVLLLDLDRFKNINDTLGHPIGDLVLKEVALVLQNAVRKEDTVARLGGDEFLILLPELKNRSDLEKTAKKILKVLKPSLKVAGHELHINASIGVSFYPEDAQNAEVLIKHADAALYHAKEMGSNTYKIYTSAMHHKASRRLTLENSLRSALTHNQFVLYYQPIIEVKTGRRVAMEALVRWQHPEQGLLGPDDFMVIAEEVGIIVPLGTWILNEVCKQIGRWQKTGYDFGRVALNISGRQFAEPDLAKKMAAICKKRGVNPACLQIEITESSAMQDVGDSLYKLLMLKNMGLEIVIDDFGTGYSNFSYLQLIPMSQIKIDRSFIRDCLTNPRDEVIVKALVVMAHTLGLQVCAEGVETKGQFDFLASIGCDRIQGFFCGKPLPPKE